MKNLIIVLIILRVILTEFTVRLLRKVQIVSSNYTPETIIQIHILPTEGPTRRYVRK